MTDDSDDRPMKRTLRSVLIGNFGEHYVASLLTAAGCFVRPVAMGTDVGIDLYCETTAIHGDASTVVPFLHFWVQVKAGKQCRLRDGLVSVDLRRVDLEYWSRQPVPVFVAMVPCEWPVAVDPEIHFADLTGHLVWSDLPDAEEIPLLAAKECAFSLRQCGGFRSWLEQTLPMATAILQIQRGIISNRPTLVPTYEGVTPTAPIHRYAEVILYQQRVTAANAIISMWRLGLLTVDGAEQLRRTFAAVVGAFAEVPNWEVHFAMALAAHAEAQVAIAGPRYARARQAILDDRRIDPASPTWSRHLDEIGAVEQHLENGRGPEPPASSQRLLAAIDAMDRTQRGPAAGGC